MLKVHQHRRPLTHTRRQIGRGQLTVGFIGGSITDVRPGVNWPEPVMRALMARFPAVRLIEENAAIGATGSELGIFRAQRDLIERGCDLVFVEFAVNDRDENPAKRRHTQEGLIRQLLADDQRDVVLVYTFSRDMLDDMEAGRLPLVIEQLEELGTHYGLGSVWMGLEGLNQVKSGWLRWDEWLPDGLHPQQRGSLAYGESVISFLDHEFERATGEAEKSLPASVDTSLTASLNTSLPTPIDAAHWQSAKALPFSQLKLSGPWRLRRWANRWMDQVLETSAPGARLSFDFEGRALTLGFDFGKSSAEFRYRLDGGDWVSVARDRPGWVGAEGWFRMTPIADDLEWGQHTFELEVIHGNADRAGCTGTNFRLALIGIVAEPVVRTSQD